MVFLLDGAEDKDTTTSTSTQNNQNDSETTGKSFKSSAERQKRQLYREAIPHHRPLSGNIYSDHHGFPHPGRWYSNAQQIKPPNMNSGHHFESPNVILNDEDFNRYGSTLRHIDDLRIRQEQLQKQQQVVHKYPVQVEPIIQLGEAEGHGHTIEYPVDHYDGGMEFEPYAQQFGHVEHGHAVVHEQVHHHHHIPAHALGGHFKAKPFLSRLRLPYSIGGRKAQGHRPLFRVPFLKNLWSGRYGGAASEHNYHGTAQHGAFGWGVDY